MHTCTQAYIAKHTHTHTHICTYASHQVKEIVHDNFNKVIDRGDKFDHLDEQAGEKSIYIYIHISTPPRYSMIYTT